MKIITAKLCKIHAKLTYVNMKYSCLSKFNVLNIKSKLKNFYPYGIPWDKHISSMHYAISKIKMKFKWARNYLKIKNLNILFFGRVPI